MNKKGSLLGFLDNMQFMLILVIVIVGVIGVIYGLVTVGPLISGEGGSALRDIKLAVQQTDNNTAIGNATTISADTVTGVTGKMELLVYAIFIGLFIGFFIVAYEVKFYPFLSWAWIALMVVVVLFAIVLSNAYQEASADPTTAAYYATWGSTGYLMYYLPYIASALGLLSGVILFALSQKSPDEDLTTGSVNI